MVHTILLLCLGRVVKMMNVFVTMCIKLFLFSTLYHCVLDIILISTFDSIDVPALVKYSYNEDQKHTSSVLEQHQQKEEAMKNPIIRKYVIRNIRMVTWYITALIVMCGLIKGFIYSFFYHIFRDKLLDGSKSSLPLFGIQCMGLIQSLMMYLGVFLLVFHLILAHSHQNRSQPKKIL